MTFALSWQTTRPATTGPSRSSPFLLVNFAFQSNLQSSGKASSGPRVAAVTDSVVVVNQCADGRSLHVVLDGEGTSLIELGGLLPERHYHTGHPAQPFLKADREGRALLRLTMHGGLAALAIEPVV
jgi:hypothetical protein